MGDLQCVEDLVSVNDVELELQETRFMSISKFEGNVKPRLAVMIQASLMSSGSTSIPVTDACTVVQRGQPLCSQYHSL